MNGNFSSTPDTLDMHSPRPHDKTSNTTVIMEQDSQSDSNSIEKSKDLPSNPSVTSHHLQSRPGQRLLYTIYSVYFKVKPSVHRDQHIAVADDSIQCQFHENHGETQKYRVKINRQIKIMRQKICHHHGLSITLVKIRKTRQRKVQKMF